MRYIDIHSYMDIVSDFDLFKISLEDRSRYDFSALTLYGASYCEENDLSTSDIYENINNLSQKSDMSFYPYLDKQNNYATCKYYNRETLLDKMSITLGVDLYHRAVKYPAEGIIYA